MTAVSNKDGKSDFFTDNAMGQLEWGAGIVESNNNVKAQKKPDGQTGKVQGLNCVTKCISHKSIWHLYLMIVIGPEVTEFSIRMYILLYST